MGGCFGLRAGIIQDVCFLVRVKGALHQSFNKRTFTRKLEGHLSSTGSTLVTWRALASIVFPATSGTGPSGSTPC